MTSQDWPHWRDENDDGFQIESSRKHFVYDYLVFTEETSASFLIWQSAEALYEPRRHPLDLLQTIGVGNKDRRVGLHSILKMGPNQSVINRANVDTDSSVKRRLIINSIRLASFQIVGG